jgi:polysaccharide biosynthesis transport protein
MITWDEIVPMLRALLRWCWVCALAVALSGGAAYVITRNETPYYVAHASLMVGNAIVMPRPDQNEMAIASSLTRFYAELARRRPILKPVQERLQLPFQWELLSDAMVTTNVIPSASLLEIYVTDSDPQRAATIANAIGDQLVSYSPTSPDKIAAEQQAVDQQLRDSQRRMEDLKAKLADLATRQKAATSASDLAEINQTIAEISSSLEREQSTYSSLLGLKNTSVLNSLSVFEPAVAPAAPLPSKRKLTIAISGLAGLLLSFAAVYLLERIDTRWRRPQDVKNRFKIAILGTVPAGPPLILAPLDFADERLHAVRDVQTNILLATGGLRTLLVSSPAASEERTSFSIDLADLFGRSGHRVLIVDADFVSSLLTKMLASDTPLNPWTVTFDSAQSNIWTHIYQIPLANVVLLPVRLDTAGAPALIPSLHWRQLVEHLQHTADVIIFDGPAALDGPDAALLAPHVDGVVLALDPARDGGERVAQSKERLLRGHGSNLLGAVTFTPSKQRRGTLWRRLRGRQHPALPMPAAEADAHGPRSGHKEPLVTPPPQRVVHERTGIQRAPGQIGPIITPPPADAASASADASTPGAAASRSPEGDTAIDQDDGSAA